MKVRTTAQKVWSRLALTGEHRAGLVQPALRDRASTQANKSPRTLQPQILEKRVAPPVLQKHRAPEPVPQVQRVAAVQRAVKAKSTAVVQRRVAPSFSRVVQATKFYPNLHPGAIEQVDISNIYRLNSFADQYRLHKVNSHGVNVPNQQYNFVRTRAGEMLLHARYRHPSIAEGKHVLYAGEIFFNNGLLEWWSNGSGHYQPSADDALQANLPMDQFFSYQQIIKGEHKRKNR